MYLWEKGVLAACVVVTLASVIALWDHFVVIGAVILIGIGLFGTVWVGLRLYEKYLDIMEDRDQTFLQKVPEPKHMEVKEIQPPSSAALVSPVPTFKELLAVGTIGEGKPIIVSWANGKPITIPRPTTVGISGIRGMGKTVTTLNLLLSYIVATGGRIRFIVTDPHMFGDTGESLVELIELLRPFFLTIEDVQATIPPDDKKYLSLLARLGPQNNPNIGGVELSGWSQIMAMELERRLAGKKGAPWMLVVDEFSSIMDDKDAMKYVAKVLGDINKQARKFDMDALLIGQDWRAEAAGGTGVRNTIPVFVAHNMSEQWSKLVLPAREARNTPYLSKGEVILQMDGQFIKSMVSYATEHDIVAVLTRYLPQETYIEEVDTDGKLVLAAPSMASMEMDDASGAKTIVMVPRMDTVVAPGTAVIPWSEDEIVAVRDAYAKGLSESEIAKTIFDASPKETPVVRAKVREIILWLMNKAIAEHELS